MSGKELKRLVEMARLKPNEICVEADISIPTLYKVYNDESVRDTTKAKVERAIQKLVEDARVKLAV